METNKESAGTEVRQGGSVSTVWRPAPRCGAGLLILIIFVIIIIIIFVIIIIIIIIHVGPSQPSAGWAKEDRWIVGK